MNTIDVDTLIARLPQISERFKNQKPFRFVELPDFLREDALLRIQKEFPPVNKTKWVDASGLHTKKKWTQPAITGSVAEEFYLEVGSKAFLSLLEKITGIDGLVADPELFGAGYHQTLDGGFLDVHVDFNYHETTQLDRRLNLIVYLNENWEPDWGGALELWDHEKGEMVAEVPPTRNLAVLFETNDISFHGHPKPWNSGGRTTRKSLSTYYYSRGRNDGASTSPHSTIYINTQGPAGRLKVVANGLRDILRGGPLKRRLRMRKSNDDHRS